MQRKPPRKKSRINFHGPLFVFLVYFLISELIIIGAAAVIINIYSSNLPSTEKLERIPDEQKLATTVYSSDGVPLRNFYDKERRMWVTYSQFSPTLIDAVLATEDKRFFSHWGFSVPGFFRAMYANVKGIRPGRSGRFPYIVKISDIQGGSTITQQLAKNLYFDSKRIVGRKIKEMITAVQIERTYSKEEILEMYLNKIDFGNNAYGIQAASRLYFGKNASDLNVSESALLAGMLQNSSVYNPKSQQQWRRDAALRRRNTVLGMMARAGKIPWWQAREEIAKPIDLSYGDGSDFGRAPYFVEHVRKILEDSYGKEFVYTSGAKVYTTLDYRLQEIAENAMNTQLEKIQAVVNRVMPYRRPRNITPSQAIEDSLKLTRVQGAMVALDVATGKILVMIGGDEFTSTNWFNRATQAPRSAGSSFKPFVYTAALDNGWRCSDTINDAYWSIRMPDGTIWEPGNFDGEFLGVLSLRDGLKLSENMISVKLVNDYENRGIGPQLVKKYARAMGITTPIPEVPSIAIGTPEVKLIEMVTAYNVFPRYGIKVEPFAIQSIVDKTNNAIFTQNEGTPEEVLNPEVASIMITLMQSVVREGTGRYMIPQSGMGDRPCAGKTGTASEYKDAWFIGYTPYLVCGVWIGFDSEESKLPKPYHTGATAAIPVWGEFMKNASELLGLPKEDFKLVGNISAIPICKDSHLRATQYCPKDRVYTEYYISGTEVRDLCDKHGPVRSNTPRDNRYTPRERTNRRMR